MQVISTLCRLTLLGSVCGLATATAVLAENASPPTACLGEELTQSALQLELEGDNDYRNLTLDAAIKHDPDYAPAQWQRGRIKVDGQWLDARAAMAGGTDNELLQEYERRRQDSNRSAKDQATLARFCSAQGLEDRARLHWHQVAAAPDAEKRDLKAAVKALQLQRVGDRVLDSKQAAELRAYRDQLTRDYKTWRPKIETLVKDLNSQRSKRRERALEELRGIQDPSAVLALELTVSPLSDVAAMEVVGVLERMDGHEATESLARHAIGVPWPQVARQAAMALRAKPMHEYVPRFLNALASPLQARTVRWNLGGYIQDDLFVQREGVDANYLFAYSYQPVPLLGQRQIVAGSDLATIENREGGATAAVGVAGNGWRGVILTDTQFNTRLWRDQQRIAATNEQIESRNAQVFDLLEVSTGEVIARNHNEWKQWWEEYNEVHSDTATKPTHYDYRWFQQTYQFDRMRYEKNIDKNTGQMFVLRRRMDCFPGGTPVWTETGLKGIESVQPGDRVLSQDPDTGELTFKVVIQRTTRPPSAILGIRIGEETLYTLKGHPFWVNGEGWRMAKRLEPGQAVHTVAGAGLIEEVSEQEFETEAYNLIVADFGTYFVGNVGALVHDNTYRSPTRAVVPGLIPARRAPDSAMAGQ